MTHAYKLFRLRKDGTLGSLFFEQKTRLPLSIWLPAKAIHKKGFAFRPGWHACDTPQAPHLSMKNRVWCLVSLKGVKKHYRPKAQGGLWFTAKSLKIEKVLFL